MKASIFQWARFETYSARNNGVLRIDDEFVELHYPTSVFDSENINSQMMRLEKKLNQCQS